MDPIATRASLEKKLRGTAAPWERLPILLQLAELTRFREPSFSDQCATEALNLAQQFDDQFWIGCSLKTLGALAGSTFQHGTAVEHLTSASRIFKEINDPRMKAITDVLLAQEYTIVGELDKALELLTEALSVFQSIDDSHWVAHTFAYIGHVCKGAGDHSKGLRYFQQATRNAAKLGDQMGVFYQDLALAYRMIGDMERSAAYLFKSLKAYRDDTNHVGVTIALVNISAIYTDQKLYSKAEKYVLLSLKMARKIGNDVLEAQGWGKLMRLYSDRGEFAKAVGCFKRGRTLASNGHDSIIEGKLYEGFGDVLAKVGMPEKGIPYTKKALRIIAKNGHQPYYISQAHESLANIYEAAGDPVKALKHHKEFTRIKNDYINQQKAFEVAQTEVRRKIKTLAKELKKERTDKSKFKEIIEQKEAELLSLSLRLMPTEEGTKTEHADRRPQVLTRKTSTTNGSTTAVLSDSWETFARQFHKVHYDFHNNLLKRYPKLTLREIKVCSLIRIGLSSKEIADVLSMSKKAVDKQRARIHKKMELPSNSSLAGFIAHM